MISENKKSGSRTGENAAYGLGTFNIHNSECDVNRRLFFLKMDGLKILIRVIGTIVFYSITQSVCNVFNQDNFCIVNKSNNDFV